MFWGRTELTAALKICLAFACSLYSRWGPGSGLLAATDDNLLIKSCQHCCRPTTLFRCLILVLTASSSRQGLKGKIYRSCVKPLSGKEVVHCNVRSTKLHFIYCAKTSARWTLVTFFITRSAKPWTDKMCAVRQFYGVANNIGSNILPFALETEYLPRTHRFRTFNLTKDSLVPLCLFLHWWALKRYFSLWFFCKQEPLLHLDHSSSSSFHFSFGS